MLRDSLTAFVLRLSVYLFSSQIFAGMMIFRGVECSHAMVVSFSLVRLSQPC